MKGGVAQHSASKDRQTAAKHRLQPHPPTTQRRTTNRRRGGEDTGNTYVCRKLDAKCVATCAPERSRGRHST